MSIGTTYVYKRSANEVQQRKKVSNILKIAIAIIVPVIVGYLDYRWRAHLAAITEFSSSAIHTEKVQPELAGKVVFITTDPAVEPELNDSGFGVAGRGLSMSRSVQYCQWIEHVTENTQKNSDGTENVQRTYWYTKEWVSSPISSLFYNDALTHFNPTRAPFFSETTYPSFPVPLNNGYSLSTAALKFLMAKDLTVTLSEKDMSNFLMSKAAITDGFRYIGDGWFYSSYQPSFIERMLKYSNFQFYDLFAKCEAGDIRAHFTVKNPKTLSIIAKQDTPDGILTSAVSSNGVEMALIAEGKMSIAELERRFKDSYFWYIWINRFVGMIWLVVMCSVGYIHFSQKNVSEPSNNEQDNNLKKDN